ncbi:MAG TPA: replication-relaxation family protein [Candidatus Sulfotelmatobacter sp.]|jgi:hypothetical protein|nr:replication-relaxation family protein [Candidatus Sulfotelmatobacter sp.]
MRIIDRETSKVVAGFGSTTRANARLLRLTRSGLLRRFFVGSVASGRMAVYTLSSKGAALVSSQMDVIARSSERLIVGDRFVEHQSLINRIYVAVKYQPPEAIRMHRWLAFRRPLSEAVKLKPDGYFELQAGESVRPMFLEVDLGTEALKVWQQKTAAYLHMAVSGEFQRLFRQPQFRVLVVANSEQRLKHIRATVAKHTDKIFWFCTFESIKHHGFWSPGWLRPTGNQRHGLL